MVRLSESAGGRINDLRLNAVVCVIDKTLLNDDDESTKSPISSGLGENWSFKEPCSKSPNWASTGKVDGFARHRAARPRLKLVEHRSEVMRLDAQRTSFAFPDTLLGAQTGRRAGCAGM